MISNPNFIYYACIARGNTVLAQYRSKEPKIEELAAECLAKTPLHHSIFSHTVKKRTYTFVIHEPFVYFAIFDEELLKSEGFWFLNRIKSVLDEVLNGGLIMGSEDFTPLCFQSQFDPFFRKTLALDLNSDSDLDSLDPQRGEDSDSRNSGMDSVQGKRSAMAPLLAMPGLKKKKRVNTEANDMDVKNGATENKVDLCDCLDGFARDFPFPGPNKSVINDRQKAKQIWKKHVWVVLMLDVFVCAVLFVIWLWVCRGFKCMDR
ncbi:phytolongin Phyl2.2-like [Neltuma alba]|uniref:phytolongin Phyl2.2-like n=1 Tax=Neltuma alba TaxID=207710 RepID=UPI0010A378D1|nr:phytolongin Phyl2.2-like [Prosopis alba]